MKKLISLILALSIATTCTYALTGCPKVKLDNSVIIIKKRRR